MNTVIYADILVVINIIVNYLLLRASAAVTKFDCKPVRFLAASAVSGLFSLIIFVDGMHWAVSGLIKILFMFFCVRLAFNPKNFKAAVKCTAAFLLANFVFAGVMLACCTVLFPNLVIYKNGVVYFDIDILTLTVSAVVCYAVLALISRLTASRVPPKSIYDITLVYGGNSLNGKALFDTGNGLRDSFSGRPVIIAERKFLEELFGKAFDCSELKNFRLIPYSTIKDGGVLPAFMIDKVIINSLGKNVEAEKIYIAVTDKKIVSGGYSVLLSTPFFESVSHKTEKERDENDKISV